MYTWKCTRDKEECVDTKDLDREGWCGCTGVLFIHLLEHVIIVVKMIVLSSKQTIGVNDRIRFSFGGTILTTITFFTIYVPLIYNFAIATREYLWTDFFSFICLFSS